MIQKYLVTIYIHRPVAKTWDDKETIGQNDCYKKMNKSQTEIKHKMLVKSGITDIKKLR